MDKSETRAHYGRTGDLGLGVSFGEYGQSHDLRRLMLYPPELRHQNILNVLKLLSFFFSFNNIFGIVKAQIRANSCRRRKPLRAECAHVHKSGIVVNSTVQNSELCSSLPPAYRHSNFKTQISTLDTGGTCGTHKH